MRIERLQHAGDGAVHQPVGLEFANVVGFNSGERSGKDFVLLGDLILRDERGAAEKGRRSGRRRR
jgi:hypothetical protein